MRAIAEACKAGEIDGKVAVVIGPRTDAPAMQAAREMGLQTLHFDPASDPDGVALQGIAVQYGLDLVCLAGYMKLVPAGFLRRFPNAVLNIHPALLPKYGGRGMYGHHVHEAVLANRESESGCSVHFVTEKYDEGAVLLQLKCAVLPDDTAESLAARVLALEHRCYVEAINKWSAGHQSGRNAST